MVKKEYQISDKTVAQAFLTCSLAISAIAAPLSIPLYTGSFFSGSYLAAGDFFTQKIYAGSGQYLAQVIDPIVNSPRISSITPTYGVAVTKIYIRGSNFIVNSQSPLMPYNDIYISNYLPDSSHPFGRLVTSLVSTNGISLQPFTISEQLIRDFIASTGLQYMKIAVKNSNGFSNEVTFRPILIPPRLTALRPSSGPVGTAFFLTGLNFTAGSPNEIYVRNWNATTSSPYGTKIASITATSTTSLGPVTITRDIFERFYAAAKTGRMSISIVNGNGVSNYFYFMVVNPPTLDSVAPSIPKILSADAVSSSRIILSWSASSDDTAVTGYNIYRNSAKIGASATNSYSSTGLSANTLYTYTVSAYDAAGNESAQSSSAS